MLLASQYYKVYSMKSYLYAFLLIALSFNLSGCGESDAQQPAPQGQASGGMPPAAAVNAIEIQPQSIKRTRALPGRVVAYRTAEIRPQVNGIIQERLFKEGSFVEEGDVLYKINPDVYKAALQRAKADLQNARATYKSASALEKRYEVLVKQQAISAQEYDDAKAGAEQARAVIAQMQAALKTAQINLDYSEVKAPISGYIGPSLVTEGALVSAQQAQAMAVIRQMDPIYVDLSQSSSETGILQASLMNMRMEDEEPTTYDVSLMVGANESHYPHTGALDATDLAVNEATGTIRLRTVFPNPNRALLPGMFVKASVSEIGETNEIIVPQKAVKIEPNGTKSVWVANGQNMAEKRPVQTGSTYQNNWIILSGLSAGDRVLIDGTMMLQPGAPLNVTMVDGEQVEDMVHADDVIKDEIGESVETGLDLPPVQDEMLNDDQDQTLDSDDNSESEAQ